MAGPAADKKRKAVDSVQSTSSNIRKRQKFQDARAIPTQIADAALSKTGELNITSFIKSREYEINALDRSMKKARQSLSTRAFQQVPRHLRRRTASHNAKKVPRRLRGRARREMVEDNTPTVNSKTRMPTSRLRLRLETAKALKKLTRNRKIARQKKREAKSNATHSDPSKHVDTVRPPKLKKNKLANPPLATSKFKRRQVKKTWLPTHLWHAKRAHMTKPTEPLWRMAIPLRPTEKCYRSTHRASESRGCIAWDTSYVSTVGCRGTETALEGLLKALGFHGNGYTGPKYERWKSGSRFAGGWVITRISKEALAEVDVIWCARHARLQTQAVKSADLGGDAQMAEELRTPSRKKLKLDRRLIFRIHPSAFRQFWTELLQAAKSQKPQVLVEDLRFEIGSVEITGTNSSEALTSALRLAQADARTRELWKALSSLSNPALLPADVALSFDIQDPRLTRMSQRPLVCKDDTIQNSLHDLVIDWPFDKDCEPASLFSNKARYLATKLPSQWALNRRRQAVLAGQTLPIASTDPSVPIMLTAHRPRTAATNQQGRWVLLAPWRCIDVIWRKLLFVPLSSGGRPRFGGLREKQQVAFEQKVPWFPGDFPGTEAGKAWQRSQTERRFGKWTKQPPSRRIAWEKLDLGDGRRGELGKGWSCDWDYLLRDPAFQGSHGQSEVDMGSIQARGSTVTGQPLLTQRQRKAAKAKAEIEAEKKVEDGDNNTEGAIASASKHADYIQLTPPVAKQMLRPQKVPDMPAKAALITVKITLIGRGTPADAARVYRLPLAERSNSSQLVTVGPDREGNDKPVPCDGTVSTAQPSPPSVPRQKPNNASTTRRLDLRRRWLSLDVHSSTLNSRTKKDKTNHHGLPKKAEYHAVESLRHINVLPKNAPQEIVEQYGPKPLSDSEKRIELERDLAVRMEEEKVWETHVPCPDADDLLGYVTSGGYNLAEGAGTAIGSIWIQRVLRGWETDGDLFSGKTQKGTDRWRRTMDQRRDRERHLCVVRNAGESVGRLALWELCE